MHISNYQNDPIKNKNGSVLIKKLNSKEFFYKYNV